MKRQVLATVLLSVLASSAFALPAAEQATPRVKAEHSVFSQTVAADGGDRTPQGQTIAEGGRDRLEEKGLVEDGYDRTPQGQVVAEGGGEVRKREYWGLRSLAYRIKKNRKGHYMLLGLETPPAALNEAERQLGLNEDVLRMLTVRVEAIEEAPSAVLSKRGGDDRDREKSFRGPRPAGRFGSGRGGGRGDVMAVAMKA